MSQNVKFDFSWALLLYKSWTQEESLVIISNIPRAADILSNFTMNLAVPTQCSALSGLNSFLRPLSVADVNSCVVVESAFPEHERCSEEKVAMFDSSSILENTNKSQFRYRLSQTPELSIGLFINEEGNERLIGHVIGNRLSGGRVTEGSILMPENWRTVAHNKAFTAEGQVIGNDPNGAAIAVHSVAISPEYQGKGVGKALVAAYIQYIKDTNMPAECITLIAHDYLIRFYESAGFESRGKSHCQFAGGGWFDMVSFLSYLDIESTDIQSRSMTFEAFILRIHLHQEKRCSI